MSEITLKGFYSFMPHLEVDANNQMLLDEATNHGTVELVHYDQLRAAAARLGSKLAIRREYADGWNQFVAKFPQYGGTYANRDVAFSLLNPYEEPTPAAFLEIAQRASRPLATNTEYEQAQEETRERAQMIQKLVSYMLGEDGKPKLDYSRIYPEKIEKYNLASLEELREYHAKVTEYRRLKAAPTDEVRQIVKADADASRNRVYERYQKLPLDSNGRPCYIPPGKSESASVPMTKGLFSRLPNSEQHRLLEHFGNDQLTESFAIHAASAARR